jgi:hypothetical protein
MGEATLGGKSRAAVSCALPELAHCVVAPQTGPDDSPTAQATSDHGQAARRAGVVQRSFRLGRHDPSALPLAHVGLAVRRVERCQQGRGRRRFGLAWGHPPSPASLACRDQLSATLTWPVTPVLAMTATAWASRLSPNSISTVSSPRAAKWLCPCPAAGRTVAWGCVEARGRGGRAVAGAAGDALRAGVVGRRVARGSASGSEHGHR